MEDKYVFSKGYNVKMEMDLEGNCKADVWFYVNDSNFSTPFEKENQFNGDNWDDLKKKVDDWFLSTKEDVKKTYDKLYDSLETKELEG